jgi:hypothetical protein
VIHCIIEVLVISCKWVRCKIPTALEHMFRHVLVIVVIIYNWAILNIKNVPFHSNMGIIAKSKRQSYLKVEHFIFYAIYGLINYEQLQFISLPTFNSV